MCARPKGFEPQPSDPDQNDELRWLRIDLLWALDRLGEARTELEMLNTAEDPPVTALRALGEIYRIEGRRADARRLLNLALHKDPHDIFTLACIGALEIDDGQPDIARTHLNQALKLWGHYPFALSQLVNLELDEGNGQRVHELLETVNETGDTQMVSLRSSTLYDLGEYEDAWQVLEDHLIGTGDNAALLRARGWVEVAMNQTRRAAVSFGEAAQLDDEPSALVDTIASLIRVGLWQEALATIGRAQGRHNPHTDTALATLWLGAGAWDIAAHHAVTGAEDLPRSHRAIYAAAYSVRRAGRPGEAMGYAHQARDLSPRDPSSIVSLAECLLLSENSQLSEAARVLLEEALDRLTRRVYRHADDVELQGWCLMRLGRVGEAADVFLRALSTTDRTAVVLLNLLLTCLLDGDLNQIKLVKQRADQELATLDPQTRRGALATGVHDLKTIRKQLPPEAMTVAKQLAAQYQEAVGKLEPVLEKLKAEGHEAPDLPEWTSPVTR